MMIIKVRLRKSVNRYLNKKHKLDLPTVNTLVREKAIPALVLTLLKQGIFLIPLAYILPKYYGVMGVWWSFPIADVLSTLVTVIVLKREVDKNLK